MRFSFHPEALAEYDEAAHFYADRQPGLDLRFIVCIENPIELIVAHPTRWSIVSGNVRRCRARVFPYSLMYTLKADEILIVAVAHSSREPGYWNRRLA